MLKSLISQTVETDVMEPTGENIAMLDSPCLSALCAIVSEDMIFLSNVVEIKSKVF